MLPPSGISVRVREDFPSGRGGCCTDTQTVHTPHLLINCTKNCFFWVFTPANIKEKVIKLWKQPPKSSTQPFCSFIEDTMGSAAVVTWVFSLTPQLSAELQSAHRTLKSFRNSHNRADFHQGPPEAAISKTQCTGRSSRDLEKPMDCGYVIIPSGIQCGKSRKLQWMNNSSSHSLICMLWKLAPSLPATFLQS